MDSVLGPSGLVMAVALGALHVAPGDPDLIVDFIPVDFVVAAALASAWFHGRGMHVPPSAPDAGSAAGAGERGVNSRGWMPAGVRQGGAAGREGGRATAGDELLIVHVGTSSQNPVRWAFMWDSMPPYYARHPVSRAARMGPVYFRWARSDLAYRLLT